MVEQDFYFKWNLSFVSLLSSGLFWDKKEINEFNWALIQDEKYVIRVDPFLGLIVLQLVNFMLID